jgi:hypothetical protein
MSCHTLRHHEGGWLHRTGRRHQLALDAVELALDRKVDHVIAKLDHEAADECWVDDRLDLDVLAVGPLLQVLGDLELLVLLKASCALERHDLHAHRCHETQTTEDQDAEAETLGMPLLPCNVS